jgi:hypothetical protein
VPGRPPRPAWLPPLPLAAAILAGGTLVAWLLVRLTSLFSGGGAGLDYSFTLSAARIGLAHGWAAIYDRRLYGQVTHHGGPLSYANTPVIAWLAAPLAGLPFRVGLMIWMVPLLLMLLATWWVAAPGGPWQRVGYLVAMLGAAPILFGISLGQFSLAVMGLLAVHRWLVGRGHPVLAGVTLGLACLKPQDAFLVPVALALTGRWRCVGAWAATMAALALAMAIALGPAGVAAYGDQLLHLSVDRVTSTYTLWRQLPGWVPTLPLRGAIAVVALVPALFEGRQRYGRAVAAAIAGSVLATPYLNWADLGQLLLAGWLVLGTSPPAWARWAMVPSYVAIAYPVPGYGLPPICAAAFWLLALALLAALPWLLGGPGTGPTTPRSEAGRSPQRPSGTGRGTLGRGLGASHLPRGVPEERALPAPRSGAGRSPQRPSGAGRGTLSLGLGTSRLPRPPTLVKAEERSVP